MKTKFLAIFGLAILLCAPAFSQVRSIPGYTEIQPIVEYQDAVTGQWSDQETDTTYRERLTFPVNAGDVVKSVTTVNGQQYDHAAEVVPIGVTDIETILNRLDDGSYGVVDDDVPYTVVDQLFRQNSPALNLNKKIKLRLIMQLITRH